MRFQSRCCVLSQFVGLSLLIIVELPGSTYAQSPTYRPGLIHLRLAPEARFSADFKLDSLTRVADKTGLSALDSILAPYGMKKVRLRPFAPKNKELASQLGLDRDIRIVIDTSVDVQALARRLVTTSFVNHATPNWIGLYATAPDDPMYSDNWGHDNQGQFKSYCAACGGFGTGPAVGTIDFDSDASDAWDNPQIFGKSSIIIAILDSGVDPNHPDLLQVPGYDYVGNDPIADDPSGHGTSVAGIAAAIADNGLGVTGVAGGCSIMPLKIGDGSLVHLTAVVDALVHAADSGANIVNMSFALAFPPGDDRDSIFESSIDYAYSSGVTLFAATGNSGIGGFNPPALYANVIAVGAASPCGERKRKSNEPGGVTCDGETWWGSNYGAGLDFLAPTTLPSTDLLGVGGYNTEPSPDGDYYQWFNGTSCSSPYAAGIAALILSEDPTLTPAEVKQRMIDGAVDIVGGEATAGYDIFTGWGMLNANNSLLADTIKVPADYTTIQAAIDASTANGDLILVDSGEYNENINFQGKLLTVKSIHGGTKTKITGSGTRITFENGETKYTVLEGFRIEGGSVAIHCKDAGPTIKRNLLVGQSVWAEGAIILEGMTPGSTGNSPAVIVNNTIVNCVSCSGIMDRSAIPPKIKNNIISGNDRYGINWDTFPLKTWWHPDLSYNDVWDNDTANYNNATAGAGSISADPKFFGAFGLKPESPCINAGDPDPQYNDPDGSRNDMGAYPVPEGYPQMGGGFKKTEPLPRVFSLRQNYPNPFNPSTKITMTLPIKSNWNITIYNIMGQNVSEFSGESEPGEINIVWDASEFASGVYFYSLRAGGFTATKKMLLIK